MTAVLCFLTPARFARIGRERLLRFARNDASLVCPAWASYHTIEAGIWRTLPREGPPKVPASKRRVDVAKRTGVRAWVGVIDCGALFPHSLLASLGLAERLLRFARNDDSLTPVRLLCPHALSRLGPGGPSPREGPPKVPASKRRVDVAKRTGVRAWVGVIDCGALFPHSPARFARIGRERLLRFVATPSLPASVCHGRSPHASRLGPLFRRPPPREGPPKVPASKRRVDVAKRTGVRAWVGVIDCGALFPHSLLASLGLAERLLRFARNDALTPVQPRYIHTPLRGWDLRRTLP